MRLFQTFAWDVICMRVREMQLSIHNGQVGLQMILLSELPERTTCLTRLGQKLCCKCLLLSTKMNNYVQTKATG